MNGGTATGNQSGNTSTLKPVGTILEGAQLKGMRTGIVTTTRVTHATPASFSAHVADRDDENEIAREQVYSLELNVLLGGGLARFWNSSVVGSAREDTLDLLAFAGNRGYEIALNADELRARVEGLVAQGGDGGLGAGTDSAGSGATGSGAPSAGTTHPFVHTAIGPRLLGLFAPSHLPYEIDVHGGLAGFRDGQTPPRDETDAPSLTEMLEAALRTLDIANWSATGAATEDHGFVLVVEAGRIDHAAHANDASAVLGEICAYDRAFVRAIQYASERDDTLVVATSDHDTGGLSVGCCDVYGMNVPELTKVTQSAEGVAGGIVEAIFNLPGVNNTWLNSSSAQVTLVVTDIVTEALASANRDPRDSSSLITESDIASLVSLAIVAALTGEYATHTYEGYALLNEIGEKMNQATGVGWTSNAHTGVDVPVFAFGVGAEKFRGSKRNSDIGKLMIDLIQVDPERGYQVFRDRIGLRDPSDGG